MNAMYGDDAAYANQMIFVRVLFIICMAVC